VDRGDVPPPRESGPGLRAVRKPALAERAPELLAARLRAARILDEFCRRRGISTAELAEVWHCTEVAAREMRSGDRPLHVAHALALPKRHARALLDLLLTALDESAAA
jgi:hypothetical protein